MRAVQLTSRTPITMSPRNRFSLNTTPKTLWSTSVQSKRCSSSFLCSFLSVCLSLLLSPSQTHSLSPPFVSPRSPADSEGRPPSQFQLEMEAGGGLGSAWDFLRKWHGTPRGYSPRLPKTFFPPPHFPISCFSVRVW